MTSADRVPGEVLVRIRDDLKDKDAKDIFAKHGFKCSEWKRLIDYVPLYLFHFSENNKDMKQVLRDFIYDDSVLHATPNYRYRVDPMFNNDCYGSQTKKGQARWPDDPRFPAQWHLWGRHDEGGFEGSINAVDSWDIVKPWESSGQDDRVTVAVLDTGVDITHKDLERNIWTNPDPNNDGNQYPNDIHGWNFVNNNNNVNDDYVDEDGVAGHGTLVAGVVGAVTNNDFGVAGTCPNVEIMPVKIVASDGYMYASNLVLGIHYTVDLGVRIINCSIPRAGVQPDVESALQYADDNNCVVIGASGNDAENNVMYPWEYPTAVAVGANDYSANRWVSSNYGEGLDLLAPGISILTTKLENNCGASDGTSLSAPQVAGVAALILSHEPSLTNDMVKYYLTSTAYKPPGLYNSTEFGHGILDAYEALSAVTNPPDISPVSEWYFPEGTTRPGFEEWICVQNPNNYDANICLELMTPTSSTFDEVRTVPKYSRTSIRINDILTSDVSVRLLADSNVFAERSIYWADRREGHTCHGLKHDPLKPNSTWYLAEGCTGTGTSHGFQTFVLVQNPNDQDITVTAEFQLGPGQGEVDDCSLDLPARSRGTIWLNTVTDMPDGAEVSTTVTCNTKGSNDEVLGILAERATYWNTKGSGPAEAYGGHCSPGVTSGDKLWYLAEGCTRKGDDFHTYVLLQNPTEEKARVNVTFMTPDGPQEMDQLKMEAKSRHTIHVNAHVPDTDVSTMVDSTEDIIAERAVYWKPPGGNPVYEGVLGPGHSSEGVKAPAKKWNLAEGCTNGFETWVLVQNPDADSSGKTAYVKLEYMTSGGKVSGPELVLAPNTRQTVNVADTVPDEWDVSTSIESEVPVVAERAMYWNNRQGGTDSVGIATGAVTNTQTGTGVWVRLPEGEATFSEVTSAGNTVIVTGNEAPEGSLPTGYGPACNGSFFHLATSAEYSGDIDVELNYYGIPDDIPAHDMLLLYYDEDSKKWNNVTTGINTDRKVMQGTIPHTGILCVAVPDDECPEVYLHFDTASEQVKLGAQDKVAGSNVDIACQEFEWTGKNIWLTDNITILGRRYTATDFAGNKTVACTIEAYQDYTGESWSTWDYFNGASFISVKYQPHGKKESYHRLRLGTNGTEAYWNKDENGVISALATESDLLHPLVEGPPSEWIPDTERRILWYKAHFNNGSTTLKVYDEQHNLVLDETKPGMYRAMLKSSEGEIQPEFLGY